MYMYPPCSSRYSLLHMVHSWAHSQAVRARSVSSIQNSMPYVDSLSYCSNDSVLYTEGLTVECTCQAIPTSSVTI